MDLLWIATLGVIGLAIVVWGIGLAAYLEETREDAERPLTLRRRRRH